MKPLLAYYGDDFTGSTDVMEALQWSGLHTVLFLMPPLPEQLARFPNLRAFGVAGSSRSMSPAEMDVELRLSLESLRDSGAPLIHYKICSTFDSSPEIGSIGRALEIGRDLFGGCAPILVGAPVLGRYTVFGNLFARSGLDTEPFRLDRHPTMVRHPITPMNEADLRRHLAAQTSLPIELFDLLRLGDPQPEEQLKQLLARQPSGLLFDVVYPEHLPIIGEMVERMAAERPALFAVGSSGIEYALTAHWERSGKLDRLRSHPPGRPAFGGVDQLVVITGSCSPVNDRQIAWALTHGFVELPLDPARLIQPRVRQAEVERTVSRAVELVRRGANVILHSSRGPDDPRVAETLGEYARLGFSQLDVKLKNGRTLGPQLGRILRGIVQETDLRRVGVAGGDTSTYVARELGIVALEALAPVAPGSPLCRMHAANRWDGLEIIFKGGQVGQPDVWGTMLHGTARAAGGP